ncbi:MAG TPA: MATE family efflux transporter [Tepidisphaeraceae bacterium]|jgi:O-antigen/teichoic acid export membrane protein
MTRALPAAYAASFARVASWALLFGIVYRTAGDTGAASVALLALARGTVGLLSYLSLGLTPVLVRLLTPGKNDADDDLPARAYATAGVLISVASLLGLAGLLLFVSHYGGIDTPYAIGARVDATVFLMIGVGTLLRTWSEWFASALLAAGRIATDSVLQTLAEVAFVALAVMPWADAPAANAAYGFALASSLLFAARALASGFVRRPQWSAFDRRLMYPIALLGGGVVLGQLADWLYAPLNQILIHRYLHPTLVAAYAVAIQIDGGLLLAVGGLANVLLPTAALLHREGRLDELRTQYLRATVVSLLLLGAGAVVVCGFAQPIMRVWFGDPMPLTRAILPLVMIHTVIGGTATVGRSVLLGIGRVRAYTLSAVAGGVTNAVLATLVVTQTSLGLPGIVYATILTVAVRCGLWMPWYILRCLRRPDASSN